jgi:hypothetical protein
MSPDASTDVGEVMRLRRSLEERDEVILRLNRQLHDAPSELSDPEPVESADLVEEYAYRARILETEVARLREALRNDAVRNDPTLGTAGPLASDELLVPTGEAPRRGTLRRAASALKRRLNR